MPQSFIYHSSSGSRVHRCTSICHKQLTTGWAVLELLVLGPPVLSSSLKVLTGLSAGEKFSNSTGLLDLATFVWEISWGCIIHESDYGSPCLKTTAANYHVQVPRPSSLASIIQTPGSIAGQKYSRSMLKGNGAVITDQDTLNFYFPAAHTYVQFLNDKIQTSKCLLNYSGQQGPPNNHAVDVCYLEAVEITIRD